MKRAFTALLWKESLEVARHALPGLLVMSVIFYTSVSSPRFIGGDPEPARHFGWFAAVTALIAAIIGFWQTYRESAGDLWGFAIHRPVGRLRIFFAKPVVGIGALLITAGLLYAVAMWWYATPGHRPVPFDRALLLPGLADLAGGISFYAAGLYAGARRSSIIARAAGFVLVFVSSVFAASAHSFLVALAIDLGVAAVLVAAAGANFVTGSDYEGQPLWGRVVNVMSVLPGVIIAVGLISIVVQIFLPRDPVAPRRFVLAPEAFITSDGRIALIHRGELDPGTGVRPVTSITDIAGNRLAGADSGLAMRTGGETFRTLELATDTTWSGYFERRSYRDSRAWVRRVFSGTEGAVWYFEKRQGLISIYDIETARQTGWLGPDGYAPAGKKPAARFPGSLAGEVEESGPRSGLLVMSGGVYRVDGLSRPARLFTPGNGERVLGASSTLGHVSRPFTQPWGAFSLVTTDKAAYVLGPDGGVEIEYPHDSNMAGRRVSAVRAPLSEGGTTFLWYHPRYFPTVDTVNVAVEFRNTSARPVARHVFAGRPYDANTDAQLGRGASMSSASLETQSFGPMSGSEVSVLGAFGFIPAFSVQVGRSSMSPEERSRAIRKMLIAFGTCLVLAAFTWWLCRRFAFSTERTVTWVVLTALLGPIALITMWLLLEWPARERCPSCGNQRAVNRERCEHCGAPFPGPDLDGTEVFVA
jgi:hypothetical protein